jgi:p-hydroxybenzoate 3-monooxygenase
MELRFRGRPPGRLALSDMTVSRLATRVGIVGAGPAGLLLSHLLHLEGMESILVENRSRRHTEERVRAGVLEQGTVDLLCASGVGERLQREGLVHHGLELRFEGHPHRIDLHELTGRSITVYGQNEVMKDLADARLQAGGRIEYEAEDISVHGLDTDSPSIRYSKNGETFEIASEFIAGCDGFHGVCRPSVPAGALRTYEKIYPFGWLGVLVQAAPASDELIYVSHDRGFALLSMRSRSVTRLYLQCRPEEDLAEWPDKRIWSELAARFATQEGFRLNEGPIVQKGVTAMRSFVVEPMQYGCLFLAGDAAHIVPPTGAKGLNLAAADVAVLACALARFVRTGDRSLLEGYSETCLRRVWRAQRFSWWMTSMLHRSSGEDDFDRRRQLAELRHITESRAAATNFAENYAGFPFEPTPSA